MSNLQNLVTEFIANVTAELQGAEVMSPLDACMSNDSDFDNTHQQVESFTSKDKWEFDENGFPPLGVDVMVSYTIDGDCDGWCEPHGPSKLVASEFGMMWIAHYGAHHRLHNAEDVEFTEYVKPESPKDKAKREREENGQALFEFFLSLRMSVTPTGWRLLSDDGREAWCKLAELVTLKDEHKE